MHIIIGKIFFFFSSYTLIGRVGLYFGNNTLIKKIKIMKKYRINFYTNNLLNTISQKLFIHPNIIFPNEMDKSYF